MLVGAARHGNDHAVDEFVAAVAVLLCRQVVGIARPTRQPKDRLHAARVAWGIHDRDAGRRDTEADLLRAICAAPDVDAPRLVYADWLMERGDPRGEFIAAQCLGPVESGARWRALLSEHGDAWAAHLRALPLSYRFERGFIAHVQFETFEGFLEHRAAVVRWMPMPKLSAADDGVGGIVLAPDRAFAAYATAQVEGYGAYGTDRHRVFDLRTAALLADHLHHWTTPAARTARCWFAAGLRTLVIEHVDDRDPIVLRF